MKKSKKVEVAIRVRPLIYQYEDVQAWSVQKSHKKICSLPRNAYLRSNNSLLNESSIGKQEDPLYKRNSFYFNKIGEQDNQNYPAQVPRRRPTRVEQSNIYEFTCDYLFASSDCNENVYQESCRKIISEFIEGNNSTIFMYGQTTSGKTYTMLGNSDTEGIIFHSLKDIFKLLPTGTKVTVSYLEIYNEQIHDLLGEGAINLKIAEQSVQGLVQCPVRGIEEAVALLEEGEKHRSYAQKRYHDHSSRSHTIFQVKLLTGNSVKSLLNLVDLSGSERLSEQENTEETAFINKSLFVLSNVIHKLANPKKNAHIPFRDSKLTRLLAPALTSSRTTLIICTVSPAQVNFSQTLSTLRFAMQSRKIELKSLEDMEKLFKEEESAVKEAVRDEKYLERALDVLQNGLSGKHPSSKISSWRAKASTLSEEYNKNILILQHEYLKAVISLTGNDFSMPLEQLYPLVQSLRET